MTPNQKLEALCIYDECMTDDERREYAEFMSQMAHLASSYKYFREHLLRYAHERELEAEKLGAEPADRVEMSEEEMDLILMFGGGAQT